jgi:Putative F0F1-ATPase subunit Ca2+/Mg2+ transporter
LGDEQKPEQPAPAGETPEQKKNVWLLVARYGHMGFILPACVFVGLLIGSALDKWLGTKSLMLVGIILGSVAGFVELIRIMMKASRE